jgi:hypothetical protein
MSKYLRLSLNEFDELKSSLLTPTFDINILVGEDDKGKYVAIPLETVTRIIPLIHDITLQNRYRQVLALSF